MIARGVSLHTRFGRVCEDDRVITDLGQRAIWYISVYEKKSARKETHGMLQTEARLFLTTSAAVVGELWTRSVVSIIV